MFAMERRGQPKKDASECEVPHAVWVAERAVRAGRLQEDVCFIECTPRYPFETAFSAVLQDTHVCLSVNVGPELLGWPHRRLRLLGVALNRRTVQWLGPQTAQGIAKDFAKRFHRAVTLSGDVFCMAPEQDVRNEYVMLARRQKNYITARQAQSEHPMNLLRMLVPPGGVQRFHEWLQAGQQQQLSSIGGAFLFDADYRPNTKGSMGGSDMPVSLRHGTVMAVKGYQPSTWRILLAAEHMAAMGFHMFPQMHGEGRYKISSMRDIISWMPPQRVKCLLGNGMHLATQGAWMLYVLGRAARKDPTETMVPRMPAQAGSSELELEDADV